MNIDDIQASDIAVPEDDFIIPSIFDPQRELMEKYHPIERKNGVDVPEEPWSLDDRSVQTRIKHFLWCTTEEVGEALEDQESEDYYQWMKRWEDQAHIRHFFGRAPQEVLDPGLDATVVK